MQTSRTPSLDDRASRRSPIGERSPVPTGLDRLPLRALLIVDAASCVALGAVLVPFAQGLAGRTGLPATLLLEAGLVLLAFGAALAGAARRPVVSATVGKVVATLNAAWVAASAAVLLVAVGDVTALGEVLLVGQAVAVAALALLEWRAARAP